MTKIILVVMAIGSAWVIHHLSQEQLAMLLGVCFGVLAGVPLGVAIAFGNKSKAFRSPRVEVEIDGVWVEVPPCRQ